MSAAYFPKRHGVRSRGRPVGANSSRADKPAATKTHRARRRHPGTQLGHVRGGLLTYWETESRARIEQNARADSQQGSIQADQIDLYFSDTGAANATKQLHERWRPEMWPSGRRTAGEPRIGPNTRPRKASSFFREGKPTLYSSTGDTTTGRQLTFYFADDRIVVDSAEGSRTVTLHRVEK